MKDDATLGARQDFLVYAYIFFCAFIMSMSCLSSPFSIKPPGIDSSVFIYVAQVILDGGMPYRDAFDHKGPLIYLIDAMGLLIDSGAGVWLLELFTIFIIFMYTYKIARLLCCDRLLSCLVVAAGMHVLFWYLDGGNYTEEYACAFIIISLFTILKIFFNQRVGKLEIAACGFSFACVCLLRPNMTALWFAMPVSIMMYASRFRGCRYRTKDFVKFFNLFLTGAAVIVVPVLFWLCSNNAFHDFINDYILFNLQYASNQEQASVAHIISAFKAFLTEPPVLVSIVGLGYLTVAETVSSDCFCLVTLLLSIVGSSISGRCYSHYGIILYPFCIYAFVRAFEKINIFKIKRYSILKINKMEIPCNFPKIFVIVSIIIMIVTFSVSNISGNFSFERNDLTDEKKVASIVKKLTGPNEIISVVGNYDYYYLISERRSASKYSYQFPVASINPKIWEEYKRDIVVAKPKVILVLTWQQVDKMWPYRGIQDIVRYSYDMIDTINGVEIYLRNSGGKQ